MRRFAAGIRAGERSRRVYEGTGAFSDGENFNMLRGSAQVAGAGAMKALPMTDDERAAWLALAAARSLTPAALRALLAAFGMPQALRSQSFDALAAVAGEAAARAILAPLPAGWDAQVARVARWCEQPGNALVSLADPAYPPALLAMPDPPPLLYVKGQLELLHASAIALVGSRNATPQGLEDAAQFARELAAAGLVIVSGLALGIDAAAHWGALAVMGHTVAVIGTGIDIVYPLAHRELAQRIALHGALVSEWPLGTPARPSHFPQRNRLIAGLAKGVLIVEAALRSGSLITARLANEMGRDVFALPGSIHSPLSRGCHRLIKEGARLTEEPAEILEELGLVGMARSHADVAAPGSGAPATPAVAPAAQAGADARTAPSYAQGSAAARVIAALGHAPATLEVLARRTDMGGAALQAALLELELAGHVNALPGGRFTRTATRRG
jgi:DNA processing protein